MTQTTIIFGDDEGTIYLRGLGLHVEINFAAPGTRYNPEGTDILACPDAMEGIYGRGETREAAAQACCDRMLELLHTPAEMFDALAEGAHRTANLKWGAAEREDHKDTPLNNEARWSIIQHHTMKTAAQLARAAAELAKREAPAVDPATPFCDGEGFVRCGKCSERLARYEWCQDCRELVKPAG